MKWKLCRESSSAPAAAAGLDVKAMSRVIAFPPLSLSLAQMQTASKIHWNLTREGTAEIEGGG